METGGGYDKAAITSDIHTWPEYVFSGGYPNAVLRMLKKNVPSATAGSSLNRMGKIAIDKLNVIESIAAFLALSLVNIYYEYTGY